MTMQKTFKIKQTPDANELVLIPNANSSVNQDFSGDSTNYMCIDDPQSTPDDDSSYCYSTNNSGEEDIYSIPNHTTETGTINFVRVFGRAKSHLYTPSPSATFKLRVTASGQSDYDSNNITVSTAYWNYYYTWTQCPWTSAAWTWTNIDDLLIGMYSEPETVALTTTLALDTNEDGDSTAIDNVTAGAGINGDHWEGVTRYIGAGYNEGDPDTVKVYESTAGFESDLYHTTCYSEYYEPISTFATAAFYHITGDSNYVYVSASDKKIYAYSYTSGGVLAYVAVSAAMSDTIYDIQYQDGYIFAAIDDYGVAALSFNGSSFTLEDSYDFGTERCQALCATGTTSVYVLCGLRDDGVAGVTFNTGTETFTYNAQRDEGTTYIGNNLTGQKSIATDGTYWVCIGKTTNWIVAYSWSGGGTISRVDYEVDAAFSSASICYDSTNSRFHVNGYESTVRYGLQCWNFNGSSLSQIKEQHRCNGGITDSNGNGIMAFDIGSKTYIACGIGASSGGMVVWEWNETDDIYIRTYEQNVHSSKCYGVWADGNENLYITSSNSSYYLQSFYLQLPNFSDVDNAISSVTVYAKARKPVGEDGQIKIQLKSGSTTDTGDALDLIESDTSYGIYSKTWTTNPDDSAAWGWADIIDLQIGIQLSDDAVCSQVWAMVLYQTGTIIPEIRTTQLYVVVNYTGTEIEVELNQPEEITWETTHILFKSLFSDGSYGALDQGLNSKTLVLRGCEPSSEADMEQLKDFKENGKEVEITGLDDGSLCTTWIIKDFDYSEKGGSSNHHYEWIIKLEKA